MYLNENIIPYPYCLQNTAIYRREKDGAKFITPVMGIVGHYRSLETHAEIYDLQYFETATGYFENIRIDGKLFTTQGIEKLISQGVNFPVRNKIAVLDYLIAQRGCIPIQYYYNSVGWVEKNNWQDDKQFAHAELISSKNMVGFNEGSRYDLVSRGTFDDWNNMVQQEVMGNTALELALVLGASSTLVPLVSFINPDISNLLVHIVGQSSSGKTTSAQLAASVSGRPTTNNRGLIRTWATTQNALMATLNNNFGIPLVLDEISISQIRDMTSLVYQLVDGNEKARSNQDAGLKKIRNWSTTIISTGEARLTEKVAKNDGLKVRILELSDVEFTTSPEQAEHIKSVVATNYGWLQPEFVRRLIAEDVIWNAIPERYTQCIDLCVKQLPESRYRHRIADRNAVIVLTAYLLNKLMGTSIDLEKLHGFIVKHTDNAHIGQDVGQEAFSDVVQYLIQHQRDLKSYVDKYNTPLNLIGIFLRPEGTDTNIRVAILKKEMTRILDDLGYEDKATILKLWKKRGILESEKDRKTNRVTINRRREVTYTLKLDWNYRESFFVLNQKHFSN
ncbi:DUF927 domain-containing protein [Liquorilactobacillus capillatus]|uniref:DUF927 domain-containing protein n=1 Tax=Liquorilactobacillus capillatus DSM 19910 TaxID=1423731 RepID=A0A0R1MAX2_9LACO|nr:DUF927 domain-containing protein [Liquorilactobacillus capillatus]KRL02373.1 hypothetical protein FC81_GL000716 [Liquorilactobacillus capillatus DSM 19910]